MNQFVNLSRIAISIGVVSVASVTVSADEISQSFLNGQLNQMTFGVVGERAQMTPTASGLQIVSSEETHGDAGLKIRQEIRGDFTFDVDVRLNDFPIPKSGYGSGVALLVEDGVDHGASLQLVMLPSGIKSLVAHDFEIIAGEHQHHARTIPAPSSELTLRVHRQAQQLFYLVSQDHGATFSEVHHVEFVATPIRVAQVYGQSGGDNIVYDVHLAAMNVVADELVRPGQRPKHHSGSRLTKTIALGTLIVLSALLFIWVVVRRRRSGSDEGEHEVS